MARLADLHRHPVKGWTPESIASAIVEVGGGLPFDRHFAFTSGRREEEPVPGGWVQARTFLQLTVFPELAALSARLESDGTLHLSAPDGTSATACIGKPQGFDEANRFIARHFEAGPHGAPRLVEQEPGYGHWDFTDTCISLINLETVKVIAEAAGRPLERERFRGNLYIEGLPAWEEFAWSGRRLTIGNVELEVLRPVQRCAMTSTEPGTGKRELDLPAIMNGTFGHNFCGVYARVSKRGELNAGSEITVDQGSVLMPYEILPPRVPVPMLWPRFVAVESMERGLFRFTSEDENWPLIHAEPGQSLTMLRQSASGKTGKVRIVESGPDGYVCKADGFDLGNRALINGPLGVS